MAKSLNSSFKAVGRNMARANNQKSSAKVPMKFAAGGAIPKMPKASDMGNMGGPGISQSPTGGGKARGGGKATKGCKFRGSF